MESKQSPIQEALIQFKQCVDRSTSLKKPNAPLFAGENKGYQLPKVEPQTKVPPIHASEKTDTDDIDGFGEISKSTSTDTDISFEKTDDETLTKAFYNLWANLNYVFNWQRSWSNPVSPICNLIAFAKYRTQIKNDIAAVFKICSNPANADNDTFFALITAFQPVLAAFIELKNSYLANVPSIIREAVRLESDALLLALQITLEASIKQNQIKQAYLRLGSDLNALSRQHETIINQAHSENKKFDEQLLKTRHTKEKLALIIKYRNEILHQALSTIPTTTSLTPVIAIDENELKLLENDVDQTLLKNHLDTRSKAFSEKIDTAPEIVILVQHRMGISYSEPFAAYTKTLIDTLAELKEQEIELQSSLQPILTDLPSITLSESRRDPNAGTEFEEKILRESRRISAPVIQEEIQRELRESQIIKPKPDEIETIEIEITETKASVDNLNTWKSELQKRHEALLALKTAIEEKGLIKYLELNKNEDFVCEKLAITHEQLDRLKKLETTSTTMQVGFEKIDLFGSYRASDRPLCSSDLINKIDQEISLTQEQIHSVARAIQNENQKLDDLSQKIEELEKSIANQKKVLEEQDFKSASNTKPLIVSKGTSVDNTSTKPTHSDHTLAQLASIIAILILIGLGVGAAMLLYPLGIGIAIGVGVGIALVGGGTVAGIYQWVTREKPPVDSEDTSRLTTSQYEVGTTDENSTSHTDSPISQPGNTTHPSGTLTTGKNSHKNLKNSI